MIGKRYRHEHKYEISYGEYLVLKSRLECLLETDPNTIDGRYVIHSIYFDNYKNKAIFEKVDGISYREKFRIRYYNNNYSVIKLEKKMKNRDLCMKVSCKLTKEECDKILSDDIEWMRDDERELLREFYTKINIQRLYPKVEVTYEREPYIYMAGNVRVTFDMNISSSLYNRDFFCSNIPRMPVQEYGKMILEVKYDDYLPEVIRGMLQVGNIRQQSFSKYVVCRGHEFC